MPRDICKLCREEKELQRSHLLPAALYDYCRRPEMEPIRVTSEIVMSTSRQTQDYLLCRACEGILNEGGEKWIVSQFVKPDRGSFPFYEMVTGIAPEFDEGDVKAYAGAKVPGLEIEKVIHFAMGLFWKASVHSWTGDKTKSEPVKLGPYGEPTRKYLLGRGTFPNDVTLSVSISDPAKAMILILEPYDGGKTLGFHTHVCYVLGVLFALSVGKKVTTEQRTGCFATGSHHPIFVMENLHRDVEQKLKKMHASAPKARMYLEAKKRYFDYKKAVSTSPSK